MSLALAEWVVTFATVYLYIGAAFAVLFALGLVVRIDPVVRDSSWGFRLALLPGATLLWPYLLVRVIRGTPPTGEVNAHRDRADSPAPPQVPS